ncbi:MAG TPA: hypothetical protein VK169_13850 [Saprospiraceae bacterium]|nr:hypothetical protein [Saprospiraceae bacterium]
MKNPVRIFFITFCVWFTTFVSHAQTVRVIDHKGTPKDVDNSKWQLSGSNIYLKVGGNVGIGTNDPSTQLHTTGSLRFSGLGTNTSNTNIMTTDGSGNVSTRSLSNILSGNAITSLNGLTNSVQSFSIGTTGTNISISSSGSTHTFNIPTASASNRGALSSADWTTFNNKEAAIVAGTNAQYFRGDKTWQTLNTTTVAEGSNLYFTNARSRSAISLTTTGTSGTASYNATTGVLNIPNYADGGITSVNGLTSLSQSFSTGTSGSDIGISSTGSTHTFNIPSASASNRGALSSADWTTFNNKEAAIVAGTNAQYYRGDKTWQTLNTTAVAEGSNLYFTNARSRSVISLTTTGTSGAASYNATTGVLNIPNYSDGGITSLNGLTSLAQSFAIGTSGSDIGISSTGSTHTFNIPTASASNRGALSSADWTTFNNKISSVSATTSSAVTTTGTSVNINNTAAHWNANQLSGKNVASTDPTEGQVLTWDATLNTWKPAAFGVFPVVTVTSTSYTLSANDHGKILDFTSNSAITITVPNTLSTGFQVSITQAGTGQISFSGSGGMAVNNRWGGTTTSGRWAKAGLEVRASNSSVLSGDVQ